jgi:hypothetical protein
VRLPARRRLVGEIKKPDPLLSEPGLFSEKNPISRGVKRGEKSDFLPCYFTTSSFLTAL